MKRTGRVMIAALLIGMLLMGGCRSEKIPPENTETMSAAVNYSGQ